MASHGLLGKGLLSANSRPVRLCCAVRPLSTEHALQVDGRPQVAETRQMKPGQEVTSDIDRKANEAAKAPVEMFSGPPQPRGKCRFQHRQYDLVRLPDGTVGFVRNAFDPEMDQMFAEVMAELFGPEPPEDVEYRAEGSR
jgi:hypothetical protein